MSFEFVKVESAQIYLENVIINLEFQQCNVLYCDSQCPKVTKIRPGYKGTHSSEASLSYSLLFGTVCGSWKTQTHQMLFCLFCFVHTEDVKAWKRWQKQ